MKTFWTTRSPPMRPAEWTSPWTRSSPSRQHRHHPNGAEKRPRRRRANSSKRRVDEMNQQRPKESYAKRWGTSQTTTLSSVGSRLAATGLLRRLHRHHPLLVPVQLLVYKHLATAHQYPHPVAPSLNPFQMQREARRLSSEGTRPSEQDSKSNLVVRQAARQSSNRGAVASISKVSGASLRYVTERQHTRTRTCRITSSSDIAATSCPQSIA